VLSYEEANWEKINLLVEELGIPSNLITSVYFICMDNVNTLWEQLTNPYADQLPPEEEEAEGAETPM